MRDERTSVANCFLPILTILRCGGTLPLDECKPLLFPEIPVHRLVLTVSTISLMVARNGRKFDQKVVFGPFWPKNPNQAPRNMASTGLHWRLHQVFALHRDNDLPPLDDNMEFSLT